MRGKRVVVQNWTNADDYSPVDSDILIMRQRVWERACYDAKRDARNHKLRTAGTLLVIACACIAWFWILAR